MLVITKQGVESLIRGLNDFTKLEQCRDEVKKMLGIKSALLWWAESGKCCSWQPGAYLAVEVQILEDILAALGEGNIPQASSLLEDYAARLV